MRFLGFVFIALIFSALILVADFYLPGNYLDNFLENQLMPILATLVGLNIAAVIFLIGGLSDMELKTDNFAVFDNTKKEIKHNIYFILLSLVASFVLLVVKPSVDSTSSVFLRSLYYVDSVLLIALFVMTIFAIFEIIGAVFAIKNNK